MSSVGIVTGGGRGMGYACAQRLAGTVGTLLLVDRDPATAATARDSLAAEHPGTTVEAVELDITDADGLARLAERVRELGTLRAVAHAAGISPTMADWRRIFTVDLIGTALLARALRPLAVSGTATVCFASMAPMLDPAAPDPAALAVLDDPLAPEFLDRIHDALGSVVEDLEAENHPSMAALVQRTPLGRMGIADEVAEVVAFALSDRASFLNGVDLLVDGGVMATARVAGRAAVAQG